MAKSERGSETGRRRSLRVCILVSCFPPDFGGHGIQLARLLPHLESEGVEPTILTHRPPHGVSWTYDEAGPVHRILSRGSGPWPRLQRIAALRRHLRTHHLCYDVVHSCVHDWEFCLHLPYLARLKLPVLHEMVLLGSNDPLTIANGRLGALRMRLMRSIDAWVGISEAFRSSAQAVGIPEARFRVIHTGVDVEQYRPLSDVERREVRASLGIPQDARVVVSVGSLIERKGMDRVLRAWEQVRPRPGRDLLLIAGPTSVAEGLRREDLPHVEAIRSAAAAPGLDGTVRIVGRVKDLERYLGMADLFVFLSRREGLGNVIIEAMACGLPSVVSPLDGIGRELIAEGETGFVMEDPEAAQEVGERISGLLAEPGPRRALGTAAREAARERFSMAQRAETLAGLYRELVDR